MFQHGIFSLTTTCANGALCYWQQRAAGQPTSLWLPLLPSGLTSRCLFTQSSFTFSRWVESIDHSADYHTWTALKTLLQRAERAGWGGIHTSALFAPQDEMRKRQKCDCSLHKDEPWNMLQNEQPKFRFFYVFFFFLKCAPLTYFSYKTLFLFKMICLQSPEEKPLPRKPFKADGQQTFFFSFFFFLTIISLAANTIQTPGLILMFGLHLGSSSVSQDTEH